MKTIWVLMFILGAQEAIAPFKPEAIYHSSKEKCEAMARSVEALHHEMKIPAAFYCKLAVITFNGRGEVTSFKWR